jgi:GTP-binding protein HflX
MDLYRERNFDEYLESEVKVELLGELKKTWIAKSNDGAIFISAEKKENITELRKAVYKLVKKLYLTRYPYKASYLDSIEDAWIE